MNGIKKGIFLDFDGTLVESLHLIKRSYDDILKTYKKVGSSKEFHALCGPPTHIFLENLLKMYNLPTTVDVLMDHHDKNLRTFYQNVAPIPGSLELIKTAALHKWTIGIVTSNNRNLIEQWILENDLGPYISFIVDGKSTDQGKPHPEPYLKGLEYSQCLPENSIAVEDSLIGVSSALSAGLITFFRAPSLSFSQKEEITNNFPSLKIISTLKEVINWIS